MPPLSQILPPLLLLGVIGCAAPEGRLVWVRQHGGLANAEYQERAQRVAAPLLSGYSQGPRRLTVQVLDTDLLGAFGWPDGQIFFTRGLIALVDDDELAAVVSHELGHFLDRGHLHAVAGLQGCKEDLDAETRADLIGVEILRRQGIPSNALPRLLERILTSDQWPTECRNLLRRRLERLSQLDH